MPLHASSSWHLSITYMPSTPCSPSLSHAYHLMFNDLIPCLFLTIYTLFIICTPCSFRIIYIHVPYVFHTLTTLSPSIQTTVEQSRSVASLCFPINKTFFISNLELYSESNLFVNATVNNCFNCLKS